MDFQPKQINYNHSRYFEYVKLQSQNYGVTQQQAKKIFDTLLSSQYIPLYQNIQDIIDGIKFYKSIFDKITEIQNYEDIVNIITLYSSQEKCDYLIVQFTLKITINLLLQSIHNIVPNTENLDPLVFAQNEFNKILETK